MKIYLTGQNNFGNRGCEALVRSTVSVIRAKLPSCEFLVPSHDIDRDQRQWPDCASHGVRFVPLARIPNRFVQWSRVCSRLPILAGLAWPQLARQRELPPGLADADAVVSIGGDNYSLDYDLASLAYFVAVAEAASKIDLPVVLWGASVGPFTAMPAVERHMAAHLQRLHHITVRERSSLEYLRRIGVTANVTLVADSAFALQAEPLATAAFWPATGPNGVLGLNLSPLIAAIRARAGLNGDLDAMAEQFIRKAVAAGFSVLLVPHVAPLDGGATNSDQHLLEAVRQRVSDLALRVRVLPSGLNAVQIKHAISGCRYFIGARTHATVAALSMLVPTISIAYSVKARGINHDLFGNEDYVLDTRQLSADALWISLQKLVAEEPTIRALLTERMPQWRDMAAGGAPLVANLLQPSMAAFG